VFSFNFVGYLLVGPYKDLLKTIDEVDGVIEGTYEAKPSLIKKNLKRLER
jgi:hypothetical protein